jgi:hypothetical protein
VVHPVNDLDISNACNFKAVKSIGLCGDLEMMDICERSAGGRLENANLFAGCTTKLDFAHFWHSGCGAKPLKMLVSVSWHKTFLHVQAMDLGPSNGQECRRGPHQAT